MKCRVCHNPRLIPLLSLGRQYLSDFVTKPLKMKAFPLDLVLCKKCGLVQLAESTPPKLLYTDHYGYQSGINATMRQELKDIVESTKKFVTLTSKDTVVDIGANDGTLLNNYPSFVTKVGFEPVKKFAKFPGNKNNTIISDYFRYKPSLKSKAKIITAISMFYDLEDPNAFLEDIVKLLDKNGIFIIQQNYLAEMIRQNAFDNIVHEHIEYYSLSSLEYLLKQHGLEVIDVIVNNTNGGSFRTYIGFMGAHKPNTKAINLLRSKEKKLSLHKKIGYKDFIKNINKIKTDLLSFVMKEKEKGKTIYLYGASTRGNTLLQFCTLDNSYITAAVERNPEKWGKIIASVDIPIISEEQARKEKPDYMLVLPWFFKEEFLIREKHYLDAGGHFIFPLPNVTII